MISYAYDPGLSCPECECDVKVSAWVIIDSREQPNAWVKCRNDTVHCFRCAQGHPHRIQAPLLLHDSATNRILYSQAAVASVEQAQQEFTALMKRAWESLPAETMRSWQSRLVLVSREMLPLAMVGADERLIGPVEAIYRATSRPLRPGEERERIEAIKYALKLVRREEAPMLWVTFVGRLSECKRRSVEGDHEENMDDAMRIQELILEELSTHDEPLRLAIAEMNLGVLYGDRPKTAGDRRAALALLGRAREVFRPRLFPQYCTAVCNNLAIQYFKGDPANRAKETEAAIEALIEGISVLSPETDARSWGELYQHLGIAYYRRVDGDAADNIERSIAAYEQALRTRTQTAAPLNWILTQMDLGNSLLVHRKGDPAENIDRAIETYRTTAEFAYQHNFLFDWARLQYDLSNAYLLRIRGNPPENAEHAISAGNAALQEIRREFHPDDWGNVQQNLGNAYRELARCGQPSFWDKSILAYRNALGTRSPEKSRADWLTALDNLAGAYDESGGHEQEFQSLDKQIDETLAAGSSGVPPRIWAAFLLNAGTACSKRSAGNEAENCRRAIELFREAIEISTRLHTYEILRRAAVRLALARDRTADWEQSYAELSAAKATLDRAYSDAISDAGKEATADSNWFVHEQLAYACLRTGRMREAFLNVEAANARVLRDELAQLPIPAPELPQSLTNEELMLLERLRAADLALRRTDDPVARSKLIDELEAIHDRLKRVWNEMAKIPEAADYVKLRRGDPLSWEELQAWLVRQSSETGLVEYVYLSKRWIAFVIRPGEAEPRVVELDPAQEDLSRFVLEWMESMQDLGNGDGAAEELGRRLLAPIVPHIVGLAVTCVVPHGLLHFLPIHALQIEGKAFIERVVVRYAPSAAIAMQQRKLGAAAANFAIAVAGNPTGDLPFAEVEAAAIAARFHCRALLRNEADVESVVGVLAQADVAHIAAHAWFDQQDPFASGILLAGRGVLDARRVMQEKLRLRLLVLSACDTGRQDVSISNSVSGLARAFLYAGVRELVLSLWPVSDLSTMLLMERFYSGLEHGLSTGEALRRAQIELRTATNSSLAGRFADERKRIPSEMVLDGNSISDMWRRFALSEPDVHPFEHPHYWAPFFLTGVL